MEKCCIYLEGIEFLLSIFLYFIIFFGMFMLGYFLTQKLNEVNCLKCKNNKLKERYILLNDKLVTKECELRKTNFALEECKRKLEIAGNYKNQGDTESKGDVETEQ